METRACQHQAVQMRDGETGRRANLQVPQHAAGRRAVPIEHVVFAPEHGGRAIGLAIRHIGDMAKQRRVQDREHRRAVIGAALMQTLDAIALTNGEVDSLTAVCPRIYPTRMKGRVHPIKRAARQC